MGSLCLEQVAISSIMVIKHVTNAASLRFIFCRQHDAVAVKNTLIFFCSCFVDSSFAGRVDCNLVHVSKLVSELLNSATCLCVILLVHFTTHHSHCLFL